MATFWLIRHGETDWNKARRYQGAADQPLNATGEAQATALIPSLQDQGFAAIITSPMQRVQQTTQRAFGGQLPAIAQNDNRLREMGFGKFEGLTIEQIRETYPEEYALWWADRTANPHGGERLHDVIARVEHFWQDLATAYTDEERVLVVAHGGILGILLCLALETDPVRWWRFRLLNCTISEVATYPQGNVLLRLNEDRHLAHLRTDKS